MSEPGKYIIARKETDGYSTRGPTAQAVTLGDAVKSGEDLARQFPNQQFVILGEVAQIKLTSAVTIQPASEGRSAPALKVVP
jgi:hypothetical protein